MFFWLKMDKKYGRTTSTSFKIIRGKMGVFSLDTQIQLEYTHLLYNLINL